MLNRETHDILNALFLPVKSMGHVLIPVGLHTLKCTGVKWEFTRNGSSMLVVELWRRPMDVGGVRVSFSKLILRHVVGSGEGGRWYDNFTVGMPYDFLIRLEGKLKQRPEFKALIGRRQRSFNSGGMLYNTFWENYIAAVYRVDEEVTLTNSDYLNLIDGDIETLVGSKAYVSYKPITNKKPSGLNTYDDVPF